MNEEQTSANGYEIDEDGNELSPCCAGILDCDVMFCPKCKERC